jgi:ribosomal protein S18 acetylase RimI-like enzyme
MMTPTLRRATEQDCEQLLSLYAEFHEFHVRGVPDRLRRPETYDEAQLRVALREIMQSSDAAIFVVDAEGKLFGFAEVYLREDEPHPLTVAHRYGLLQSLYISAPFRRSGWGRQLVVAAQRWARQQGATEMQLETWEFEDGPLLFYELLGYRTLKRHLVLDFDESV